jgi:hypothetical protein
LRRQHQRAHCDGRHSPGDGAGSKLADDGRVGSAVHAAGSHGRQSS